MNYIPYFFTIFLIIGALEYGNCHIKCYTCSSKEDPKCLNPDTNGLEKKKCNLKALETIRGYAENLNSHLGEIFEVHIAGHEETVPWNCIKQVTKVGNEEYTIRGCQVATDSRLHICNKVIETADADRLSVLHCSTCTTDGCNLASNLKSFPSIFLLIPIGMQLLTFIII